jgi:hypothetical protein
MNQPFIRLYETSSTFCQGHENAEGHGDDVHSHIRLHRFESHEEITAPSDFGTVRCEQERKTRPEIESGTNFALEPDNVVWSAPDRKKTSVDRLREGVRRLMFARHRDRHAGDAADAGRMVGWFAAGGVAISGEWQVEELRLVDRHVAADLDRKTVCWRRRTGDWPSPDPDGYSVNPPGDRTG